MTLDEILRFKIEDGLDLSDAQLTTEDMQNLIKTIVDNPSHFAQLDCIYLPRMMDSIPANFQELYSFAENNNFDAIYVNVFNLSNTTLSDLIKIIQLSESSQSVSIHGVLDVPIKQDQFSILLQNDLIKSGLRIEAETQLTRRELFDKLKVIAEQLIRKYVTAVNASTHFDKDEDISDSNEQQPHISKLEFIIAKDHYDFDKRLLDTHINNVIDTHLRARKKHRLL